MKRRYLLSGILLLFCMNLYGALDGSYRGGFGRTVRSKWIYEDNPERFILVFLLDGVFLLGLAALAWIYAKGADEK